MDSRAERRVVVAMVRAGGFGAGALAAGVLLTAAGNDGLRVAVAVNAVSFLVCALLLAVLVHPGHHPTPDGRPARLRADRRFLTLIAITGLFALGVDFYLVGTPVYVLDVLAGQPWLPGVLLAVSTTVNATCGTLALRATRRISRIAAMRLGMVLGIAWCAVSLVALAVPVGWLPPVLLAATLVIAMNGLLFGVRANALAAELAPAAARGRYLAMFQYAFTVPGVLAPAVTGLFTVAAWLPWLVVAGCAAVGAAGLGRLA
ncbi:MAG TPA: MFS transporter [Actinophytocola sp.]|nr:MFS transporter [Actinophytocola sp.]